MNDLNSLDVLLIEGRETLLKVASADVKKWCAPSSELVGKKRADTFWIELFGSENPAEITEREVHLFLTSFQLTNRVEWDKPRVARLIMEIRASKSFDPMKDVPELAQELQNCNKRRTRQTSAASKIAVFSKVMATVFIWDQFVSKSARWRDWIRGGRTGAPRLSSLYLDKNQNHDYPAFFAACDQAFEEEQSEADFHSVLSELDAYFRHGSSVMANRATIRLDFIQRRLLDKLMFWEGWVLDHGHLPPPLNAD